MRLNNGLIRFDFDDATGSVRQITDRKTGKRWLDDPRGARLAKLIVPTPEHLSRPLYSHEAGRPKLRREGDTLTIEFPELRHRGEAAGVFLTLRVPLDLAAFPGFVPGSCTLFVEGEEPRLAVPRSRGLRRTFAVTLPPFAAAVLTVNGSP
jgi:hypothetical protein